MTTSDVEGPVPWGTVPTWQESGPGAPSEPLGPGEIPEPDVVDVPEPGVVDVPEPGVVEVPEPDEADSALSLPRASELQHRGACPRSKDVEKTLEDVNRPPGAP